MCTILLLLVGEDSSTALSEMSMSECRGVDCGTTTEESVPRMKCSPSREGERPVKIVMMMMVMDPQSMVEEEFRGVEEGGAVAPADNHKEGALQEPEKKVEAVGGEAVGGEAVGVDGVQLKVRRLGTLKYM